MKKITILKIVALTVLLSGLAFCIREERRNVPQASKASVAVTEAWADLEEDSPVLANNYLDAKREAEDALVENEVYGIGYTLFGLPAALLLSNLLLGPFLKRLRERGKRKWAEEDRLRQTA